MNHHAFGNPLRELPRFTRLNYFFGQALGHHDFADEQRYFREKLRLRNRCLHGWGVICGLQLSLVEGPIDPCYPELGADPDTLRERAAALESQAQVLEQTAAELQDGEAKAAILDTVAKLYDQVARLRELAAADPRASDDPCTRPKLRVSPGVAIDRHGRELVLPRALEVDLWATLSEEDRRRLARGGARTIHVSLCYCEAPLNRVRPIVPDPCGPIADNYTRIIEGVKLELRVDAEPIEELCNPCCEDSFADACVPLARIVEFRVDARGKVHGQLDHGWRRNLAVYDPVRITGISWVHGQQYPSGSLERLLGRADASGSERGRGLEFRFSRPVRADSFGPGVFEVLRYAGGGAPAGSIAWIAFEPDPINEPFVDRIVFRQATNERWSPGDQVMIRLRGDFVLDHCRVPLDATHIGGCVPLIREQPPGERDEALRERELESHREARYARPEVPSPPAGSEWRPSRPAAGEDGERPASPPAAPGTPEDSPSKACAQSPRRAGPWTSGNGVPGGDFVSWIYVR